MSEEFLERLRHNRLTNIEQYRRMQEALAAMKAEDDSLKPEITDDWTQWQLLPVSAEQDLPPAPGIIDSRSDSVHNVHRAISRMDSKNG